MLPVCDRVLQSWVVCDRVLQSWVVCDMVHAVTSIRSGPS